MLKAITTAKKKNDRADAEKIADLAKSLGGLAIPTDVSQLSGLRNLVDPAAEGEAVPAPFERSVPEFRLGRELGAVGVSGLPRGLDCSLQDLCRVGGVGFANFPADSVDCDFCGHFPGSVTADAIA